MDKEWTKNKQTKKNTKNYNKKNKHEKNISDGLRRISNNINIRKKICKKKGWGEKEDKE